MSESSSTEPQDQPESNPLDLSDLQSFSFGTQWTDAGKKPKGEFRDSPGRDSRRPRRSGDGGPAKDRRPQRRAHSDHQPRGEGAAHPSRGPREGGERRGHARGDRGNWRRGGAPDRPYESAIFDVGFYPDDTGFTTIIKALRANHITYELFEVAKIFLEKSDRFVASVTRKAAKGEKPERVFVSIADGMPFETEDEAIQHAVSNNVDQLFDTEEIEVEAPSGNFQFVNRCGITKVLLGPPNYHRYEEFVNRHHQTRLSNMSFERFKSSIEQVREEETINEWLESMKTTKRYTSKPAEGEEVQTFDSLSDAIGFLRTSHRDKIVKAVNYARVSGVTLDTFANTEASRAVAGELERQRRFPLETANAIRGRLRREKFSIYKKGSKGVTHICSAKRRFRAQGQVMSDTLNRLIRFLEENQNIKGKELPPAYEAWLNEQKAEVAFDENKLFQDLHWLIADGYVSHFGDDTLFAQPVLDNTPRPKAPAKARTKPKASAKTDVPASAAPSEESTPVADTPREEAPVGAEALGAEATATLVETPSEAAAPVVAEEAKVPEAEAPPETEGVEAAPEAAVVEATPEAVVVEATPEAAVVEAPEAEAVAEIQEAVEPEAESPAEAASSDESDPETEKAKAEA